jgi:FkbM family methyltransferase
MASQRTEASGSRSNGDLPATADDVRSAYRLILGREPDGAGYANYLAMLANRPLTTREVCTSFLSSTEFIASRQAGQKVDLGDVFVVVDPTEPQFGRAMAGGSIWEPHVVGCIQANLSEGHVFVDVGANVGVMSFKAARVVGPAGKVISFEPNEDNARLFLQGLLANRFNAGVRLYRFALSDRADIFDLEGGANSYLSAPQLGVRLAQSVRGDEILAAEPAVHLIKLDIEGHEPLALRGLAETISRHRPAILCEFNPRCLENYSGSNPEQFAAQIFELAREVQIMENDGQITVARRAADLMRMWRRKNLQAAEKGTLPEGMLHFDLFFRIAP